MAVGNQELPTDKLNALIAGALAGKMNDYRSVHMLLLDRLVVMPVLPSSSMWDSDVMFISHPYTEGQAKIPVGRDEQGLVVPIFTQRSTCLEWLVNLGETGDAVPVYLADFSRAIWKSIRIVLNPGAQNSLMLDRSYVIQAGDKMLGVEQGLYSEFYAEPDPNEISKMASLTESERVLTTEEKARLLEPLKPPPDPIAEAGGIDFRTPEFKAEMAAAAAEAPKRARQGTFTKILDALKAYRK